VQAREAAVVAHLPGAGERGRQVGLLGQEVGGAVAEPSWLHHDHLPAVGNDVDDGAVVVGQPGQPRLHAVEDLTLGEALPLLPAPRFEGDQLLGALPHGVGGQQLAARERLDDLDVGHRALVAHGERREAVHLVAPHVDADRPISGGREEVDDGATDGELATVLHLGLAPVPGHPQPLDDRRLVAGLAVADHQRSDGVDERAEALDQRPDRGDDHRWHPLGGSVSEPPDGPQPAPHGLDAGADPFERQRLPRREQLHRVVAQEGGEVTGQALGLGGGGNCDEHRPLGADLG
jgi:hypothetical protein